MTCARVSRRAPLRSVLGAVAAAAAVSADAGATAVAGSLLLAAPAAGDSELRNQVLWILGAAVVGGVLGWGVATVAAPAVTSVALGFGIAIGGGFGAVVRLLAVGGSEPRHPEEVTVGGSEDASAPQPADLFEDHPDPVVYFDDTGDGPVVRAVNDAYTDRFGVSATAVENAGLGDALMATERVEDVVAAAGAGDAFDAVVPCETGSEEVPFRLRTITAASGDGTRGYVLYTPVERT